MRVEPQDWRPPAILGGRPIERTALLLGLSAMLAFHIAVPALVGAVSWLFLATGVTTPEAAPPPPEEPAKEIKFIEAKFVKLGKPLPERKLPNKEVPTATQAPPAPSDTPSPFGKKVDVPDASVPTPQSADDLIAVLGNRADEIAKRKNAWDQEGSLDGIEEGTEKPGEGDVYAGLLYNFFRRGWVVPTSITDEDLKALKCTVAVDITSDARVGDFRVVDGSGNADFDDSVRLRVSQAEGAQLPMPDESVRDRYLGATVTLRFLGRHAGR